MTLFLIACIIAGTPLLLAILGEIITEKSGSLNLGVEGMMLLGAVAAFAVALDLKIQFLPYLQVQLPECWAALYLLFLQLH